MMIPRYLRVTLPSSIFTMVRIHAGWSAGKRPILVSVIEMENECTALIREALAARAAKRREARKEKVDG